MKLFSKCKASEGFTQKNCMCLKINFCSPKYLCYQKYLKPEVI